MYNFTNVGIYRNAQLTIIDLPWTPWHSERVRGVV
jgi:hypothetical protein